MKTESEINVQSLLDFINHDLLLNRPAVAPVTAQTNLISTGVIDSLSLIQLVTYLERATQLEIQDEDVTPDNFQSVTAILNYLQQRSA